MSITKQGAMDRSSFENGKGLKNEIPQPVLADCVSSETGLMERIFCHVCNTTSNMPTAIDTHVAINPSKVCISNEIRSYCTLLDAVELELRD